MAGLFAVNRGVQLDDAVLPLLKAGDDDGGAVRHLALEAPEQLLADYLGAELLFRLVGEDVVREEVRPLLGEALQLVHEGVETLAGFGADGHDGRKVVRRGVGGDYAQELGLLNRVNLVDGQHGGHAGVPYLPDKLRLLPADGGDGLDDEHDGVDVRNALAHDLVHILAEAGARAVEARRVHEDELRLSARDDAGYAPARGLRLVRHYRDLLAHKGVGERALADVGAAGDGYHGVFSHIIPPKRRLPPFFSISRRL